ncbi:MAG TPA: hypothetical protein VGM03_06275 [Phycisphaerae bacterium]|jgi:hypothetical protein
MKNKMHWTLVSSIAGFGLIASAPAAGQEAKKESAAAAQLERLKKLAGKWQGTGDQAEHKEVTVSYKVTAGGSAVMETLFADTPNEMVTVYTLDGDDLVLTHYCMMGNQPHMKAEKGTDAKTIKFICTGHGGNMKSENDPHMHAVTHTFVDDNHLVSEWVMQDKGQTTHTAHFELQRVKS